MPAAKLDTRESILDAAQRLVARKGYMAVGLSEILAEAGVPKGSFYHWFDSKDAFGEALMQRYFDRYLSALDEIVADKSKCAAEHLMRYWRGFYDLQVVDNCQGRCLVVKLGAEVSDLSEAMRVVLKVGTTGIVDRLERMISEGLADGSVAVDAGPRETAEALYDAWLGASVLAKIHRSPDYLDRVMATTRRVLHV
jgi:TetR/AcrR family transcriptional regulator, transcriptional repressor for nem operon